jgi:hypothetical protein
MVSLAVLWVFLPLISFPDIPLPEHPRPDHWRTDWQNLNGEWDFQFDLENKGEIEKWFENTREFSQTINVPFSWGAPLSGVGDDGDIGWYKREILVPESWKGKRIFLVIGASDWTTSGWLDNNVIGQNRGGYTPFEFELTSYVKFGEKQNLTLRVDDTDHEFKLEGKQGYGKARGIWQTIYLEARGEVFVDYVHITPNIRENEIIVEGQLSDPVNNAASMEISIKGEYGDEHDYAIAFKKQDKVFKQSISIPDARLWTLEDPHLYNVKVNLKVDNEPKDNLNTYFGMREIGVGNVPGTDYPYVTLNNEPVYLQLALDQAYHPEGFYTFPSDAFMRDEIIRSKQIGLNGQRIHVKIGIPRKLYWADKLGLLIMADVPNSWGEPDQEMRYETEKALRDMIKRDYNHPSVFSWIIFNETWGLFTNQDDGKRSYLPETKAWVTEMYELAKSLDPTRLVEDNSANRRDHVATDLNTWHAYLPGYSWKEFLKDAVENTYEGSQWNFSEGFTQGRQPMLNSECGNVWGYQGSTGDVDWSWDYHIMINEFRLQPKIAGWLYTEHHDVINEWNGYYKYDRSMKYTGLEDFNGMILKDLHSVIQITPDINLMSDVKPGKSVEIPLWLSVLTDKLPMKKVKLSYQIQHIDILGNKTEDPISPHQIIEIGPWQMDYINPLNIMIPEKEGILIINYMLESTTGNPLHKNFSLFRIQDPDGNNNQEVFKTAGKEGYLLSFKPDLYTAANWSNKSWNILEGKKVNGSGHGYFEYELDIPDYITNKEISEASFKMELSSKQLFGKDRTESEKMSGDYMRGRGTHDPSRNPNAYPMTDDEHWTSYVRILINDVVVGEAFLADDPADHRGILSWHAQPKDGKLREAGSYGYLVSSAIPEDLLSEILEDKKCKVRIEVPDILPGGVAIYGKDFGRYPLDPTLIFNISN